jgi:hypothetical protein
MCMCEDEKRREEKEGGKMRHDRRATVRCGRKCRLGCRFDELKCSVVNLWSVVSAVSCSVAYIVGHVRQRNRECV